MSRGGVENIQSDCAFEHMAAVGEEIIQRIDETVASRLLMEPDEPTSDAMIMDLEILLALHEAGIASIYPTTDKVARWRDAYLSVWDDYIGVPSDGDDFAIERRAVIVTTFERLGVVCRTHHGG